MSCPYLEKGRIAYCHAFGGEGIEVKKTDVEGVCFSGEFGECSFLFLPPPLEYAENRGRKNWLPVPPGSFSPWPRVSVKGASIG